MASQSIEIRAATDLAVLVQAQALTGDGANVADVGSSVYTPLSPDWLNPSLPCVMLDFLGQTPREGKSNFVSDAVDYPLRCQIVDVTRPQPQFQQCLPVYLSWFETIQTLVRALPKTQGFLPNTPECWDLRISAARVSGKEVNQSQTIALEFTVLVKTVRVRTVPVP